MKKRMLILAIVGLTVIGSYFLAAKQGRVLGDAAYAFGNLTIFYQDVPINGSPIFTVTNMLPLDCETREIVVQNDAPTSSMIAVRSTNESQTKNLPQVLSMVISEQGNDVYGGTTGDKTVADFFADSDAVDGIPLSILAGNGESTTYEFKVCMQNVGNEYQQSMTQFDLIWGELDQPIDLPAECAHLTGIITKVIEGTEGPDVIEGSNESELILGKGGSDVLLGKNGDDCIMGGPGADKLNGGNGDDVLVAEDGNDVLVGGNGNDRAYGGNGNDVLDTSNGNDWLYGQAGKDILDAGGGDDYLDGGDGVDGLNGKSGTDTCVNGETYSSCEL